jgi:hypothetical protein
MKTENVVTHNLSEFGSRERKMTEELLKAWREQGLPDDFYDDETVVAMNKNSGNVFLTNSDYQVAMMNGDKLESFYSCPQCGHEGFLDEMEHEGNSDCQEYLNEIKKNVG